MQDANGDPAAPMIRHAQEVGKVAGATKDYIDEFEEVFITDTEGRRNLVLAKRIGDGPILVSAAYSPFKIDVLDKNTDGTINPDARIGVDPLSTLALYPTTNLANLAPVYDGNACFARVYLGDVLWGSKSVPFSFSGFTEGQRFPDSGFYTDFPISGSGTFWYVYIAQDNDTDPYLSMYCQPSTSLTSWNVNGGLYPDPPRTAGTYFEYRAAHLIGLIDLVTNPKVPLVYQRVKNNLAVARTLASDGRFGYSFGEA